MNVYMWSYLYSLTDSYHSGGGALAVAATVERARELINERASSDSGVDWRVTEYRDRVEYVVEEFATPTRVWRTSDSAEEVAFIFPDAGCC